MTDRAHAAGSPALLEVSGLEAWYGKAQALHGLDFTVREGELVTLIGRNGAGKSTTLKSIMGLMSIRRGSIRFDGRETIDAPLGEAGRLGIGYCPEERGIYASLTVQENLTLLPQVRPGGMTLEELHALFPNLKERAGSLGTKLSGGEQQMLAIARILRTGARLLLLDEPTEGLAPVIVQQISALIATLKARGYTIVLVEQNLHFASKLGDRHYVLEQGRIIDTVTREDLATRRDAIASYLGL